MELRHLRYFVAVGRCLSFTKAAELLHVSQPPLSRAIQELEEEVGTVLLERAGKKTSLTPAGTLFLGEAERLLEGLDAACRAAKETGDGTRALRIGCVNFSFNSLLGPFIEEVRQRLPAMRIDLRIMPTEAQERSLLSGALDVGFVRSWLEEPGLVFEPLAEEPLALICPAAMRPDSPDPGACLSALARRPFVAMDRKSAPGLVEAIGALCVRHEVAPIPSYTCNDAFSIIGMVASGLGWSIVPGFEVDDAARTGLERIDLGERIVIGMCYRKEGLSAPAQEFVEAARKRLGTIKQEIP